jgi:hypothetical protein
MTFASGGQGALFEKTAPLGRRETSAKAFYYKSFISSSITPLPHYPIISNCERSEQSSN